MSLREATLLRREDIEGRERLQDHYKTLNPHLRAALIHARVAERRERPEPCGGDSDMD
ncbi:hypothetical protein OSH08_10560 [Kaistia geumhonensis]|uniref:Uncharacterized protein n=1 Tax=Kaistia geumhonensis TaxID=410839 RepID=A0ABU0M2Y7_9HYPH|nr:hypothetical protein [Kaistia geumhonensis]MCX5479448.1 hypothetical protein [Kaistia geumhonensis]MDQ0515329.1 hypothetical protein [Kaistia geumhonensis]